MRSSVTRGAREDYVSSETAIVRCCKKGNPRLATRCNYHSFVACIVLNSICGSPFEFVNLGLCALWIQSCTSWVLSSLGRTFMDPFGIQSIFWLNQILELSTIWSVACSELFWTYRSHTCGWSCMRAKRRLRGDNFLFLLADVGASITCSSTTINWVVGVHCRIGGNLKCAFLHGVRCLIELNDSELSRVSKTLDTITPRFSAILCNFTLRRIRLFDFCHETFTKWFEYSGKPNISTSEASGFRAKSMFNALKVYTHSVQNMCTYRHVPFRDELQFHNGFLC